MKRGRTYFILRLISQKEDHNKSNFRVVRAIIVPTLVTQPCQDITEQNELIFSNFKHLSLKIEVHVKWSTYGSVLSYRIL